MDWMDDRWLTVDNAKSDSQKLIEDVTERIRARESNPYGELTPEWRQAAYNLRRDWFRISIGMSDGGSDRHTMFLSESKGLSKLEAGPIVPFTHWLGSLYAQLREAAEKGEYPKELKYGPPGKATNARPVGPLVEYQIENGRILDLGFHSADRVSKPATPDRQAEPATARASLRPIWLTIDPEQDSNFRTPFHGVFVLSGGPGTGKTSVALLRIRFLIEQQRNEDMAALLPQGMNRLTKDFFTERDMLVVVWERHLEPYLRESLVESRFSDVPVTYYGDWLNDRLRSVVPIGQSAGQYKIDGKDKRLEAVKRQFSEAHLGAWISSWEETSKGRVLHPVALGAYQRLLDFLAEIRDTHRLMATSERAAETWEILATPVERARFQYSTSGIDTAVNRVRAELDGILKKCAQPEAVGDGQSRARARPTEVAEAPIQRLQRREQLQQAIPRYMSDLSRLRGELQSDYLNRYPHLLVDFYQWATEPATGGPPITGPERAEFLRKATERIKRGLLSNTDRVLILWMIQLIAERAKRDG